MIGQARSNGISSDYDGSYRLRNMLKYKRKPLAMLISTPLTCLKTTNIPGGLVCATSVKPAVPGIDYHPDHRSDLGRGMELHPCRICITRTAA